MSPQVRVEVAFASNPDDPAQQWTDISEHVRGWDDGLSWSRGRRDVDESAEPGSLTLRLSNEDGRFTWGNAASPYYPGVLPGKRIRVLLSVDGVTWMPRWDGYVSGWPMAWAVGATGGDPVVSITAVDRLSRFGRLRLLRDAMAEQLGVGTGIGDVWRLA